MLLRLLPFIVLGAAGFALYFYRRPQTGTHTLSLTKDPFPFGVSELNGQFSIRVPLENDELYDRYFDFFEAYGFTGNGYCWEGHIIQILEKVDADLLKYIEFDAEAGAFYAYADSRAHQVRFVNTLSPIFQDLNVLARFVRVADKSRVLD